MRKTTTITVWVTGEMLALLKAVAEGEGLSLGEWIRRICMDRVTTPTTKS